MGGGEHTQHPLGPKPHQTLPLKCPVLRSQGPCGHGMVTKPLTPFLGSPQNLPARWSTRELGLLPSPLHPTRWQQLARSAQAAAYEPQSKQNTLSTQIPPFWDLLAFCSPEGTLARTIPSLRAVPSLGCRGRGRAQISSPLCCSESEEFQH